MKPSLGLRTRRRTLPGKRARNIAASLTPETVAEIEKIAEADGISRTYAAGRLIEKALMSK
jgi:hypothetical protein